LIYETFSKNAFTYEEAGLVRGVVTDLIKKHIGAVLRSEIKMQRLRVSEFIF
jgi:hypothetical protein